MKTVLIMKDQIRQIVLTPEDEDEKQILKSFANGGTVVSHYFAKFHLEECRGGWLHEYEDKESLILIATPSAQKEVKEE